MAEETKQKAKHESEPWTNEGVSPTPDVDELIAIRSGDETVAYAMDDVTADFIAAAPELAEAEKRWLDPLPDTNDLYAIREWVVERRETTRAALAKAEVA